MELANLTGATLSGTRLSGTVLLGAKLEGVDLQCKAQSFATRSCQTVRQIPALARRHTGPDRALIFQSRKAGTGQKMLVKLEKSGHFHTRPQATWGMSDNIDV